MESKENNYALDFWIMTWSEYQESDGKVQHNGNPSIANVFESLMLKA